MQGLLSFECTIPEGVYVPDDMLLPLTTLGSNLQKLRLCTTFYKGMPAVSTAPAGDQSSVPLRWCQASAWSQASAWESRPSSSTLVQRVDDLQLAPATFTDPIIFNLVKYGWCLTHQPARNEWSGYLAHCVPAVMAPEVGEEGSTSLGSSDNSNGITEDNISTHELSAAAVCVGSGWQYRIHQIQHLQCLHLTHEADRGYLDVLVDCLQPGLRVFRGEAVRITSLMAAATAPILRFGMLGASQATRQLPELQELVLKRSLLSSPSSLASDKLQKLTVVFCRLVRGAGQQQQ